MEVETPFNRERLNNGVQIVGQPMAGVESVALGFLIGTGARDETRDQAGISHFTEQMLFRGTNSLDARRLSERFDILGIDYDSSAGLEMSLFSAVLLGTRLTEAIDLLAEVLHTPSFPAEEVDGVRTLILQEIRQREDRPAQIVMDLARQRFFEDSPLMNDYLGTDDSINRLQRSDLVSYWRGRYTANNLTISVAGNFHWESMLPHLRATMDAWPGGSGRMIMQTPRARSHVMTVQRDTAQEHICLALPAVSATDPDYYAMSLMTQIFAGVSASRLRVEVREKRGLAYAAYGRFDGLETTGMLRIYVGTSAERAHESVDVVLAELRKLESEAVTEDELQLAKTRVKSQLVMRSESTSARMATNLRSWWFEQKLHSLEEIRRRIDDVTVQQIRGLLERLQIGQTVTAVGIGPRSEAELFGDLLGASV